MTSVGMLCPPFATLSATRIFANSTLSSQKNNTCTTYPFSCALFTRLTYDFVASVVSIENDSSAFSSLLCV